jgi:hypothetical protein
LERPDETASCRKTHPNTVGGIDVWLQGILDTIAAFPLAHA